MEPREGGAEHTDDAAKHRDDDAVGMANLCVATVRTRPVDSHKDLRLRLEKRMKAYRKHF